MTDLSRRGLLGLPIALPFGRRLAAADGAEQQPSLNALPPPDVHAVAGMTLIKRLTFIARNGRIEQVCYPVFPPDKHAEEGIAWLRADPAVAR